MTAADTRGDESFGPDTCENAIKRRVSMDDRSPRTVTRLLMDWRGGDGSALDELLPQVYEELRRLARRYMSGERPGHTLQTTALVHEAYIRLIDAEISWQDRAHFFSVAARAMRRILVDHARAHLSVKRGEGEAKVSLDEALAVSPAPAQGLLDLDEALERLSEHDTRKSRIVELHVFGGLTYDEIAEALEVSAATVRLDMRFAKAWLRAELEGTEHDGS